jgi:hypothetical protein
VPSLTEAADSGTRHEPIHRREGPCAHRMRVVGRVSAGSRERLDCEQPLRAVCVEGCGHAEQWRCDSYGCEPCSEAKRRRLTRLVDNGAALHLANGMTGYFVTLTAPGQSEHRRWVQGRPRGPRAACDCHRHGQTDGLWNAGESACWNRLRTALTRGRRVMFCGAVETQRRGMLHRHVLLFTDGLLGFREVQDAALAAGYGCVVDVEPVRSSEKASRYISKYVTKASRDRAVVPWEAVDQETGEISGKRPTYRLWSSSRAWGVTMREIRAVQAAQARQRAHYLLELASFMAEDVAASFTSGTVSDRPDPPVP